MPEKLDQTLSNDPTVGDPTKDPPTPPRQGWIHLLEEELALESETKKMEVRTTSVLVITLKLKQDSFAAWAFLVVPTLSISLFNIIAYILPSGEGMLIWLLI